MELNLRIIICQSISKIGDISFNADTIISNSLKMDADIIVFPELFLTGYCPRDLLYDKSFLNQIDENLVRIRKNVKTPVLFGSPIIEGDKVYNGAVFYSSEKEQYFKKKRIPFYNVFDENRYFLADDTSEEKDQILSLKGHSILITICEDIWETYPSFPNHYTKKYFDTWKSFKKDIMINLSASPYSWDNFIKRKEILVQNARCFQIPIIYVNAVGLNEEIIFDGQSCVLDKNGTLLQKANAFKNDIFMVNSLVVSSLKKPYDENKLFLLYQSLIFSIGEFVKQTSFKKVIVGLSGGIDSTLVTTLLTHAIGNKNVKAYMLPSLYNSKESIDDSIELSKNLNIDIEEFSINDVYFLSKEKLNVKKTITDENLQSRIRSLFLMSLSSENDALLVNCSNKSEIAMGYSTLYGDTCGAFSPIGDLYKSEVYDLSLFINKHFNNEIIPKNILLKEPSAELRENQKDTDSLPDYYILDKIIKDYIEDKMNVDEIVHKNDISRELVEKTIHQINKSEFKRFQFPPIFRVSDVSFGVGRRISLSSF